MTECKSCNFGTPDLYNGFCGNCYRARNQLIRELINILIDMLGDKTNGE